MSFTQLCATFRQSGSDVSTKVKFFALHIFNIRLLKHVHIDHLLFNPVVSYRFGGFGGSYDELHFVLYSSSNVILYTWQESLWSIQYLWSEKLLMMGWLQSVFIQVASEVCNWRLFLLMHFGNWKLDITT